VWNPTSPINLITTIDEDSNPVVHLWDLKNYLAPVETLRAHTAGVLSASFSPHDHDLLISSGRDGKVVCWDLGNPENEKVISESAGDSFWKFDVQWSPSRTCIAATCSLSGQVRGGKESGVSRERKEEDGGKEEGGGRRTETGRREEGDKGGGRAESREKAEIFFLPSVYPSNFFSDRCCLLQ
jgi:WD40 repeat protein